MKAQCLQWASFRNDDSFLPVKKIVSLMSIYNVVKTSIELWFLITHRRCFLQLNVMKVTKVSNSLELLQEKYTEHRVASATVEYFKTRH